MVVLKLLNGKLYVPFSLLLVFCLAEFGVIIGTILVLSQSSSDSASSTVSRLLYGIDYSYRTTISALLIISLVLNYLVNLLYLPIFCKYLWPMLGRPKQIDYISNGVVLFLATATDYRLGFLSVSQMFPKPLIPVDMASRLTPINYLSIGSMVLSLVPFSASIMLIYN